jgi:hypothetical protein
MDRSIGRFAPPVSAETVIGPLAPTFTVATAKTPVPFDPGMFTMPSPLGVATRATISGVGVVDADSRRVLSPDTTDAELALAQLKLKATSVGGMRALGLMEITNVWKLPGAMLMGVFGVPVSWFVAGFVVWYWKDAGMLVAKAILHPVPAVLPMAMVANTVAVVPT